MCHPLEHSSFLLISVSSKSTFSHASYASLRPAYPPLLYNTLLAYHHGPRNLCVDLGCGHGLISESLAPSFGKVIGTDPSPGMLEQARTIAKSSSTNSNIEYKQASAEDLSFVASETVDMAVAGQAAHWFDYTKVFPEMKRLLRKEGTLAWWGYKDHVFVDYPVATDILNKYAYGLDERLLGSYWQQPGRSIVQNKLRDIHPPQDDWEDIQRIEYEPGVKGRRSGEGTLLLEKKMELGECAEYVRTWSSYHGWRERFPGVEKRSAGGKGDVVDELFDEIRKTEKRWQEDDNWLEEEVDIEWGSAILLARRK
jgi:SAM-dependent methyltransferase